MSFELLTSSGYARRGALTTKTSKIQTPVFMPVGTYGTVKGLTPDQLHDIGFEIILGNAFHLFQRPGLETIKKFSGLHKFMGWNKSILTDSGGFQIWSLKELRKISEEGVEFKSPLDGSKIFMSPEDSINTQLILNSDIVMAFDECTNYPSSLNEAEESMNLTHRWTKRSVDYFNKNKNGHLLFGIVQGGMHNELRLKSLEFMNSMKLDGIALGGLSVGESKEEKTKVLKFLAPHLQSDKPHYVMGVGTPEEIVEGVRYGIDMFDCVMPTRNARNGLLYTMDGTINIKNKKWENDFSKIDENGTSKVDHLYSKAYLRHLMASNEILGKQIASIHNLAFYLHLMKIAREKIQEGDFTKWKNNLVKKLDTRL